jgi:hypothetical protein
VIATGDWRVQLGAEILNSSCQVRNPQDIAGLLADLQEAT